MNVVKAEGVAYVKPIERTSVVDQIIDGLNDYISDNKLVAGDQVPSEMQVCKMFNVGRSTVREAYRTMQTMGLIEIQRGKGAFLKHSSTMSGADDASVRSWFQDNAKRLTDYFDIRLAMEIMAVRQAVHFITDQQIAELREINRKFAKAAEERNPVKMALYDKKFHLIIAETTANHLLIKIEELTTDCISDYLVHTYMLDDNGSKSLESHKAITEALAARDYEKSVELMAHHLENSMMRDPV